MADPERFDADPAPDPNFLLEREQKCSSKNREEAELRCVGFRGEGTGMRDER